MKKLLLLVGACLLCACSTTNITNTPNPQPSDNTISTTCTLNSSSMDYQIIMAAKNDEINKMDVKIKLNTSSLGVNYNLDNLTDEEKELVKKQTLSTLGFDKDMDGLDIEINLNKDIEVIIHIDLEKCSDETLAKVGMNNVDFSLKNNVQELKSSGYSCD